MSSDLAQYPRPSVAVDVALLSVAPVDDGLRLVTLVQQRTSTPAGLTLPGRFIRERETIHQTVEALLREKLRIAPKRFSPALLRVFDAPDRDERGWTISLAHAVALPWPSVVEAHGEWLPVRARGDVSETLLFDHRTILREAVHALRDRYETAPDPDLLLTGAFTMRDLQHLHEAVLGERVQKDTFNRRMRPQLVETDPAPSTPSRPGRPAQHYRHPPRPATEVGSPWRLPRRSLG